MIWDGKHDGTCENCDIELDLDTVVEGETGFFCEESCRAELEDGNISVCQPKYFEIWAQNGFQISYGADQPPEHFQNWTQEQLTTEGTSFERTSNRTR